MHAERNNNLKVKTDLCEKAESIAANAGDWPEGTREFLRGFWPISVNLGLATRQPRSKGQGGEQPQSSSSTTTFSPVTRWARAAAMNWSTSPSSTSDGVGLVTPVRKSFTI